MKASIRQATREDIMQVYPQLPCRMRGLVIERDGKLQAIGGLLFREDGLVVACLSFVGGAAAKDFAVTLHKAGLLMMRMAKDMGLRRVVASADLNYPAAERWLARLGFEPFEGNWLWKGAA